MQSKLTEVQRLDFVARSYTGGMNSAGLRLLLTVLCPFILLLAFISGAPLRETLLLRVTAVIFVFAALLSWIEEKYAGFGCAAIYLLIAVGVLLSNDYSRTPLGWTARLSLVLSLAYFGFCVGRIALRATLVRGEEWKQELEQVEKWIRLLENSTAPAIVQFSSESFWTGYFSYRMLKTGPYWVIAKFKKGKDRIIYCRVLELNAVRPAQGSAGVQVLIDNRPIPRLKISSETQPRLLAYVK